ncbi:MAG: class I tRNA ligase family protein, partial [Candidatus Korarchaeota archaeon]|nr:class I tRNA ligase family protein [Candidatus Korarchaeota archaeon]NIU84413.1 class I tRNA ligase family protein [Candidatus Thorarchaeota archaeon]NIW14523.1 class I tRNA ligase family protein [Candidatus Thorarchaeota archaeon]
ERLGKYSRTESKKHKAFVQKIYKKVYENGYIITKKETLPYCPTCEMFLPDRFVEGTCPYCGYEEAQGN